MSSTSESLDSFSGVSSVAEANDAIRRYVAGRTSWTLADLAELDRLRAAWQRAVRAEVMRAA